MDFPNPLFPAPVVLSGEADVFRVSYQAPEAKFDSAAVLYLRAVG